MAKASAKPPVFDLFHRKPPKQDTDNCETCGKDTREPGTFYMETQNKERTKTVRYCTKGCYCIGMGHRVRDWSYNTGLCLCGATTWEKKNGNT